jgi:hypothetical protein
VLISELRIGQSVIVKDGTLQADIQGIIIGLGDISCGHTPSKNIDMRNRVLIEFDKNMINSILQKFNSDQRFNILSNMLKNKDNFLTENICWGYRIDKIKINENQIFD